MSISEQSAQLQHLYLSFYSPSSKDLGLRLADNLHILSSSLGHSPDQSAARRGSPYSLQRSHTHGASTYVSDVRLVVDKEFSLSFLPLGGQLCATTFSYIFTFPTFRLLPARVFQSNSQVVLYSEGRKRNPRDTRQPARKPIRI